MSTTTLSAADQKLSADQQAEILRLKQAWADANAAGDTQAMAQAHADAEKIRNASGYSGGSDGSAEIRIGQLGGYTADQVQDWVADYEYLNYDPVNGWQNGFSVAMNQRSMSNFIRQQMYANSQAWADADADTRAYLHQQNEQLAQLLNDTVGGETYYNEELGRWETWNANLGYGVNMAYAPGVRDREFAKSAYGMTDEQMDSYFNDTDRYRNYVDQRIVRNWYDESSGYTGIYSQFVNGPYGRLLAGTNGVNQELYMDVIGDGFAEGSYGSMLADFQANGPMAPPLKNNNGLGDYTRQFASYVDENGIIQPGDLVRTHPGGGRNGNQAGTAVSVDASESTYTDPSGRQPSDTGGDRYDRPVGTTGEMEALLAALHGQGKFPGSTNGSQLLKDWQSTASQQVSSRHDYAVDQAVAQLLQAQKQAEAEYRLQQDQIAREERNAMDNSALYAELRGDRGGIGQAQYNQIQAQAAANRQLVNTAQTQLAAETQQKIAQLRAEGEFEKADALLEVSQTYLLKLLALEQWAAEFQLDTKKFEASVSQWQQEYGMKILQLLL